VITPPFFIEQESKASAECALCYGRKAHFLEAAFVKGQTKLKGLVNFGIIVKADKLKQKLNKN